ncbi:MAG TPA: STAS domain-containing protein [Acidimicrobiia bacterium]
MNFCRFDGRTGDEPEGDSVTHALRPPRGPKTVVLVVGDSIARPAVPGLCNDVRRLLATRGADLVTCDVAALAHPDAAAVDALARLQLTARRLGRSIRLRNARVELCDLLALTGLRGELPVCPSLLAQPQRQPEHREELRIDEEVDPADPSV